jgi:hypothetical protein
LRRRGPPQTGEHGRQRSKVRFKIDGIFVKALPATHLSFSQLRENQFINSQPLSYLAASLGKIPTTSVRRLIAVEHVGCLRAQRTSDNRYVTSN